jgi:peptide chain release factor 2
VALKPEEIQPELERIRERVGEARRYLNFERIRGDIARLEDESGRPGFWDNPEAARELMRRLTLLKRQIEPWEALEGEVADAVELAAMADGDAAMIAELGRGAEEMSARLEMLETRALMTDPLDANPAYLYIHAGAGGTESCDWAAMLLRLYLRWCEQHEMAVEEVDMVEGEEAGIRSATLRVTGDYAYGQLKCENGIHRLVRISPFDANKRRHTSFCSVYAWPEVDDAIEVELKDEDLKIDAFRAGGAGGQHVNKTSSAIRITHLPTSIVVQCQNERSQHQNKAQALKMLRSRLYQFFLEQKKAEQAIKESQKKDISWGNQIRSYVFQPYQLVKDHRTGHETGNIIAVMDGALDGFIEACLRWMAGMPSQEPAAASKDLPE